MTQPKTHFVAAGNTLNIDDSFVGPNGQKHNFILATVDVRADADITLLDSFSDDLTIQGPSDPEELVLVVRIGQQARRAGRAGALENPLRPAREQALWVFEPPMVAAGPALDTEPPK